MPHDQGACKPVKNSPNLSAEMLGQRHSALQQRSTVNDLSNAIANTLVQTSNNTNGVSMLDNGFSDPAAKELRSKLNEFIDALRRSVVVLSCS